MAKIKKGSIIEYNANNGAWGIVENIGKKKITVRKAIGNRNIMQKTTKIYFHDLNNFEISNKKKDIWIEKQKIMPSLDLKK